MRPYLSALTALTLCTAPLAAQSVPVAPAVVLGGGVMQYDLSGTGDAMMWTARVETPWTRVLILEGGAIVAHPGQQFGDTTTFVVIDAQAQLQWPVYVFRPYVGVGPGVALDFRSTADRGTQADLTLSAAAGVRAPLRDRLGIRAELRVRGIGERFTSSTAEWTLAVSWRL